MALASYERASALGSRAGTSGGVGTGNSRQLQEIALRESRDQISGLSVLRLEASKTTRNRGLTGGDRLANGVHKRVRVTESRDSHPGDKNEQLPRKLEFSGKETRT